MPHPTDPPIARQTDDLTALADAFECVDTWVFDLDNPLYPPISNLFDQVDERMGAFIAELLSVDRVEARRVQKDYYIRHGTTLSGLIREHGIEPERFLDYVHDIDVSHLVADRELAAAIGALPGRRIIFTNGSRAHAENVTRQLEIEHLFEDVFDISAAEYVPKPNEEAYRRFLDRHLVVPERAAMFEDIARNLEIPHTLGMRTVWVKPGEPGEEAHERLAHEGAEGDHVQYTTENLAGFLDLLLKALPAQR